MKRTRRNHGATFKAQVAVAAIKGDKALGELAEQFSVHPTQRSGSGNLNKPLGGESATVDALTGR